MIRKSFALVHLSLTLLLTQNIGAIEDTQRTLNILTIKTKYDESKSYQIKKIVKTRNASTGNKVIQIYTHGKAMCEIDLQKIINAPRVKYESCSHCLKEDKDVEKYYSDLFLNRRQPHIVCDMFQGELIGFSYTGGTVINGESVFKHQGFAFDAVMYEDDKFGTEDKPDAFDRVINDAEDILLKFFFEASKY